MQTIYTIRHSTSSIAHLEPHDRSAAISAYDHALHIVFIVNLIWSVLAVLAIFIIKDEPMPDVSEPPASDGGDGHEEQGSDRR